LYPGIEHVDAHAEAPETQKPTTHETSDREIFNLELIRNTFLYLWDKTKWSESIQSLNLTHSKRGDSDPPLLTTDSLSGSFRTG
jgi:hypothetical protein